MSDRELTCLGHEAVRFAVCVDTYSSLADGEIPCVIGQDVKINHRLLESFCFRELKPVAYDLLLLAGAVAFADRHVRRHLARRGWARTINITLPVHEPERWRRPSVLRTLVEVLRFATGDDWWFDFVPRRRRDEHIGRYSLLPLDAGPVVVMPFSNGLDSFAQWRLLGAEEPHTKIIRLTIWNQATAGARRGVTLGADGLMHPRLSVPVHVAAGNHAEPTYRTRTFLFDVVAGIAAHLSGAERVVVAENGQGGIGPSLVPFGCEWPYRGSHPGFTRRLTQFLSEILGDDILFEHPRLWNTKGQLLQLLKEQDIEHGWEDTSSCTRDQRHISLTGSRIHCGTCGGCLLRRIALFAAGYASSEKYYFDDLTAPTLEDALIAGARRSPSSNDKDIAAHSVLSLDFLARAADLPTDDPSIRQVAFELAPDSYGTARDRLRLLLSAHREEWRAFIDNLGAESWVRSSLAVM